MAAKVDLGFIDNVIDKSKDRLNNISKEIWSNPEGSLKEVHAHNVITQFLSEEGFEVERSFVVGTGFRASFQSAEGDGHGAHVCLLCEYDAIPVLGHAAGHNLSTEAAVAAALIVKEVFKQKLYKGKITVLGTPAENSGEGTKIDMINNGAFEGVDVAMLLTSLNCNIVSPTHYLLVTVEVSYKGRAAHASAFPWEGRNALDAAVACYNNIALMRQQLKPTWVVNGIITKGGLQPNLIPDHTELKYWLRAPTHMDLVHIQQKCQACFVAAAKATGCEVQFDFNDKQYLPMQNNMKLGDLYKQHAVRAGLQFSQLDESSDAHSGELFNLGSTDMGNVSQIVPCINPAFDIGTRAPNYSSAFCEAAGTPLAHERSLLAAKALALTAIDVLQDPALIDVIKSEYVTYKSATGHPLLAQRSLSITDN